MDELEVASAPEPAGTSRRRRNVVLGVLAAAAVGIAVTAPFAPGGFLPDAVDQYEQTLTGRYTDWHAPALTWLWGAVGLQPLWLLWAVAATFAVGSALVLQSESTWPWALGATLAVILWPLTLGLVTVHDKTVWFTAAFVFGVGCAAQAVRSAPGASRVRWLVLAGLAWWVAVAARSTAVPAVAPAALVALPLPEARRWAALAKRTAMVVLVVVTIVGSQSLFVSQVVDPLTVGPEQATYVADLAGISVREDEMLLPEVNLKPGATLDQLRAVYGPGSQRVFWDPASPVVFPMWCDLRIGDCDPEEPGELARAWRAAIVEHPWSYVRSRAAYGLALMGLRGPLYGHTSPPAPDPYWGVPNTQEELPEVRERLVEILDAPIWSTVFRPWVWAAVLAVSMALRRARRSPAVRMLVVGGLGHQAAIVLGAGTAVARYSWPMMVCAVLVLAIEARWAWEALRDRRARRREQEPSPRAEHPAVGNGDESSPVPRAETAVRQEA